MKCSLSVEKTAADLLKRTDETCLKFGTPTQCGERAEALGNAGPPFVYTPPSITQRITLVRIESRLDYVLASAVWDRLLDLPSGFFRQYGAGDMAERAAGISAMRGVISGAGVGGILGAISSLAYLGLMLTYDVTLTAVAVLISLVLVGFTTIGNYWQLRDQRDEIAQRGAIMKNGEAAPSGFDSSIAPWPR